MNKLREKNGLTSVESAYQTDNVVVVVITSCGSHALSSIALCNKLHEIPNR